MLVEHGSVSKVSIVNTPTVRYELAATLEETLRLQQRLMDDVRDEAVPVADLVAQVTVLERLDDRRDQLISQLRRTASAGMRPARTSPPVREVLLETLAHFRWPHPGAGGAPQLADQPVAPVVKPLQHAHLRDQLGDRHSFVTNVLH